MSILPKPMEEPAEYGRPSSEQPVPRTDPKTMLDTVNDASGKVSLLHGTLIAACAYVLVIVFGTTDLDLLIGKGIRLPFVDVEVPIVGFYSFAPFLLVSIHFNLLLQLQIFSRMLHEFNRAADQDESIRYRLHKKIGLDKHRSLKTYFTDLASGQI